MADKIIRLKYDSLPFIQADESDLYQAIRYRIISEDRNRYSYWSPIFKIVYPPTSDAGLPYTTTERIHIDEIGNSPKTLIVLWSNPSTYSSNLEEIFGKNETFDIYIRWSTQNTPTEEEWEDWQYASTVSSNTLSLVVPSGKNAFGIEVQLPTLEKNRDTRLTLFKSERTNL